MEKKSNGPRSNQEHRGLIHLVKVFIDKRHIGIDYYEFVCGKVISRKGSHADTDAPPTCLDCIARGLHD